MRAPNPPSSISKYLLRRDGFSCTGIKVGGLRALGVPLNPDTVSILLEKIRGNCRLITQVVHQRRVPLNELRHIN